MISIVYDKDTKTITPLSEGSLLIYLYNGLNREEHLDSFIVNLHLQK